MDKPKMIGTIVATIYLGIVLALIFAAIDFEYGARNTLRDFWFPVLFITTLPFSLLSVGLLFSAIHGVDLMLFAGVFFVSAVINIIICVKFIRRIIKRRSQGLVS